MHPGCLEYCLTEDERRSFDEFLDLVDYGRRLWHTATPNGSDVTRKVLF